MEQTDERIAANRANAAKSTGPRTPEGKRNSSLNAKKFDAIANAVLLEGESRDSFSEYMRSLIATFQPDTFDEYSMVETMVVARWRIHRLWAIQTAGISDEQRRRAEHPSGAEDINLPTRAMRAMESLAEKSRLPDSLHRYEARYEIQYNRAADRLARLKNEKNRKRSHQPIENKEEDL